MKRHFLLLALAVMTVNAHATIWFGFTGSNGEAVIAGLSSGPITTAYEQDLKYVGHIRLRKHFIGIGAFVMTFKERERAAELETASASSEDFLAKLEKEFPERRFVIGSIDGKVLGTAGLSGCNSSNIYCGTDQSGSFHVNGGGLVDSNVLLSAKRAFETQSAHLSDHQLTCRILDAIVASGGEIKEFQNGVIWTGDRNGELRILESQPEAELLRKLKSRFCP